MGKKTDAQRLGHGSSRFRAKRRGIDAKYISYEYMKDRAITGEVLELIKENGRNQIIARVLFENNEEQFMLAPEGLAVNQNIVAGNTNEIAIGNILPLGSIPDGCPIFNIEVTPGDGGKMVHGSGTFALVVTKDKEKAMVKLPSGKSIKLPIESRATIGCVSCGQRKEKPMLKAGKKYFAIRGKGKLWPRTRGVAKNPLTHPFGGCQHHAGKGKSSARGAPPGRKVGNIASKRTGRRKR